MRTYFQKKTSWKIGPFTDITVCTRCSDSFYIVTYYINRVTTFWTGGIADTGLFLIPLQINSLTLGLTYGGPFFPESYKGTWGQGYFTTNLDRLKQYIYVLIKMLHHWLTPSEASLWLTLFANIEVGRGVYFLDGTRLLAAVTSDQTVHAVRYINKLG